MKKNTIVCFGTLVLLLCGSLSIAGSASDGESYIVKDLVRIDISQENVILPSNVEIVAENPGDYVDIIIPRYRLQELTDNLISYTTLIADMDAYDREMMGSYHTYPEMESILAGIADNYPDITSLFSIGTTYEGRTIWCLEISDNPGVDEGEPGVFFMGLHHAREWPTVEICLYIANNLTLGYGVNSTITDYVDNQRIWIVPCMNPDGYVWCHDQGHDWRKNRHYFSEYGTYGVDLNRNYPGSNDGDAWGEWGSIFDASVTHDPGDEVYCGPNSGSELETQAIMNFFTTHEICASISWHTYQEELYWPWGYTSAHVPDYTFISTVGTGIASRITRQSGSGTYTPGQSYGLYGTTGDNIDWEYGFSHYVLGRTAFAYTIEACSSFHPSASYLDQICKENCDGGLYLLSQAQNIHDTVVARVMPPILDTLPNDTDGNYRVSWEEQNPVAEPDYFQLDELSGLTIGTDDAESGSGLWTLDGFALSTQRYHSGSSSFKSRYQNSDVSSMTTMYPIPITAGMKLSFWCWYNTESDYDDAFAEVSTDGRHFDVLDVFTGSSGSWQYKEYDLNNYSGKSVFIRFRYTTDTNTLQEGFYVDDIAPIVHVDSVTTLSNSIINHYYDVTGKTNGTYYYQVKGHNSAWGWCDFSTLGKVIVILGEDVTPPVTTCTLNGDLQGDVYVSDVTVTLTATDDSGIDYTKYKLDGGAWTVYTAPFIVSSNGNHTVAFYSADIVGNIEMEKTCSFTIEKEVPNATITIKGGLGVSATITNTGDVDLTNLDWTLSLDGKLIFAGKTKTGTIASLPVGESVTVSDFVVGLGKTGITLQLEGAEVTATGTVLLIFVLGVQ
jgi:murein tripeptide amidase MpaA